jgi:hypothetical protein
MSGRVSHGEQNLVGDEKHNWTFEIELMPGVSF